MALSNDGFDSLPDALLLVILSLLPFKDIVKTTILSRRWNETARSFSKIELDEDFFVKHDQPQETMMAQRSAFIAFANAWILRYRELVVTKFSLKLTMPENAVEFVRRCIFFAALRSVKELRLDFSAPNQDDEDIFVDFLASFDFPIEACELLRGSLEYLKLYSCSLDERYLHHFHALKEVSLGWMEVSNDCMRTLLSTCPNLRALSLKRCWNDDGFDLGEAGLRLRKLVVDKCHFHFDFFILNSPFLRVFKYSGPMYYFFLEYELLMLDELELDFSLENGFEEFGPNLYDFLYAIVSAEVLTVDSILLQVVPCEEQLLRVERNLKVNHLILKTALHEDEFLGIAFMLNSCPWLQQLTIVLSFPKFPMEFVPPIDEDFKTFWEDRVSACSCVVSTLEEVEFKRFKGNMNEVTILTHFITYGTVLKKMTINIVTLTEEYGDDYDGGEDDGGEDDEGEDDGGEDDGGEYDGGEEDRGEEAEDFLGAYRRMMAEGLLTIPKASNDLEIIII